VKQTMTGVDAYRSIGSLEKESVCRNWDTNTDTQPYEKFILAQIETWDLIKEKNSISESKYQQWKRNLAFMIKNNITDWNTQKAIFQFSDIRECKKWLIDKIKKEGLI